jgi:hypothetical protein
MRSTAYLLDKQHLTDNYSIRRSGNQNKKLRLAKAEPQLRRLIAGFPPHRPGFEPGSVHVRLVALRAGVLRVLRFSLPIFIPPAAPQSPSCIIWNWYNRSEVAVVPSVPKQMFLHDNMAGTREAEALHKICGSDMFPTADRLTNSSNKATTMTRLVRLTYGNKARI